MTTPITIKYIGSYFKDIKGKELTMNDLAYRLERRSNTVRVMLRNVGAIERGTVTDEDLGHYLPDKATMDKQKAALELSARPWR